MFVQLLITGCVLGTIYGLIALGYSLIYKASGLMSFVQGDVMTIGAYLGLTFYGTLHLPYAVSLLLTVLIAFLFGMGLEKGVIRKLLNKNVLPIYAVLATIAISYILQNGAQLGWGTIALYFPSIFKVTSVKVLIKAYCLRPDLDPVKLKYIPLVIAGWCRYLLGVDDNGNEMQLSSDTMLNELKGHLNQIKLGNPEAIKDGLRPILSDMKMFGSDLYEIGLGEKIEDYFKEMISGSGAVRATLKKYLDC